MSKEITQGAVANESGKKLEDCVEEVLKLNGFKVFSHKNFSKMNKERLPERYVVKRVPYKNIYESIGHTEFVLYGKVGAQNEVLISESNFVECRIECKQQSVAGSVDEKFPNLILNAENFPEKNVVIVAELSGARESAVKWLDKAIEERSFKQEGALAEKVLLKKNLDEFSQLIKSCFD